MRVSEELRDSALCPDDSPCDECSDHDIKGDGESAESPPKFGVVAPELGSLFDDEKNTYD